MKVVVIGGTGLVGSQVVQVLREDGHDLLAASPDTGVNTVTGEGLVEALAGADVVVDVSNSPSFSESDAVAFFRTATTNLHAAETAAGVQHHVALSVVGTEELAAGSGYFRAKLLQEQLIQAGPVAYTIVRSTQIFEFLEGIADSAAEGDTIRLAPVGIQPIASADVAAAVARIAAEAPAGGIVEIAGPQRFQLDELIAKNNAAEGDSRTVVVDATAPYWGAQLRENTLTPGPGARVSQTSLAEWKPRQAR